MFEAITRAIDLGLVEACHDLSEGGLAVAAAEMALAGRYGINLNLKNVPRKGVNRDDFILFSESNSRFLVEVKEKAKEEFEASMEGNYCAEIGEVTKSKRFCIYGVDDKVIVNAPVDDLSVCWKQTFQNGG
jgi:phosphoribosylformylglycinamidine synthase